MILVRARDAALRDELSRCEPATTVNAGTTDADSWAVAGLEARAAAERWSYASVRKVYRSKSAA